MSPHRAYPGKTPKRHKPLLARPTHEPIDLDALIDRTMRRFPNVMARLHGAELREAEEQARERRERGWDKALASEQRPGRQRT